MRVFLGIVCAIILCVPVVPGLSLAGQAQAAECIGENCPPPTSQGHDCERERQEQTTS